MAVFLEQGSPTVEEEVHHPHAPAGGRVEVDVVPDPTQGDLAVGAWAEHIDALEVLGELALHGVEGALLPHHHLAVTADHQETHGVPSSTAS